MKYKGKFDLPLLKIAAEAADDVYKQYESIDTTQFWMSIKPYKNGALMVVSFAGTNEGADWLDNLNLLSKDGIKQSSYEAVMAVFRAIQRQIESFNLPVLVTGHSLGGAHAVAFKKLFDSCIETLHCAAFCPARSLRYWTDRKLDNTVCVIDPDDPVPMLGAVNFGHPKCERITLPDNLGMSVHAHFMQNVKGYIDELV